MCESHEMQTHKGHRNACYAAVCVCVLWDELTLQLMAMEMMADCKLFQSIFENDYIIQL